MLTNYSDGFIPKWSKRTFMDKYLVLDKYFYKMCSQSPYWSPVSLSHVLFESDDLSRVPGLRKMCTDHEGMAVHSPRIPVQSNHLISIEGLLCRLCCAGQAAKESGLVSFSLRPVLPQNTLSNSIPLSVSMNLTAPGASLTEFCRVCPFVTGLLHLA